MTRLRLSVFTIVFASALTLSAQSSSPVEGKWVFNPEKSIFSPDPLPKSETLTFANDLTTVEGVSAQVRPFVLTFTSISGKAVPVNGGHDLTAETKEAGNTMVHMWSDHSGTSYGNAQISEDGKTMRYVLIGTRWGNHVHEVSIFERQ